MELLIVLVVVGLLVVAGMAVMGIGRRGDVAQEDTPDDVQLTDTAEAPPAHPDRPVPGSAPDRARKGEPTGQDGSEVARRRG